MNTPELWDSIHLCELKSSYMYLQPLLFCLPQINLCASRACYVDCGAYITVAIGLCFAHRSASATFTSAIRHKLGLTVTITAANILLTLSYVRISSAQSDFYPFVMERPLFIPDATSSKKCRNINAFQRFLHLHHLGVLWHKLNLL